MQICDKGSFTIWMCLCFLLGSDLKSYRQKHKVCLSTEIIPGLSMGEMLCPFSVCVFRMFWYTRVLHDLQAKEMDCYLQLKGFLNVVLYSQIKFTLFLLSFHEYRNDCIYHRQDLKATSSSTGSFILLCQPGNC